MVKVIPRVRRGRRTGFLVALMSVVLLLIVTAYFPFRWDPPRMVSNDVTRSASGPLQFGEMNRARTSRTPGWLWTARESGVLQIKLEVDPRAPQKQSPASMMMLARDFWHTDFAVGQDHDRLLFWVRRPGSDANGNPALTVPHALRPLRWNRIEISIEGHSLQIDVDGKRRLTDQIPGNSLRTWGTGRVALGGEVDGGGPWLGEIRRAEVRTPDQIVNYARPGALSIPARFLYLPDHIAPFPPLSLGEWVALLLHFLSFIVVGSLIVLSRNPPLHPRSAILFAAVLALLLGGGKFLFDGRHTGASDIVVQTAGALLGALLAWSWAQGSQGRPEQGSGVSSGTITARTGGRPSQLPG
jgi:hypothetical protein